MARVTVEDCIVHIPNRFDLLLVSARRAKQISSGTPITVSRDNDKDSVVSLREIAEQTIDLSAVREDLIQSFCKRQAVDVADRKLLSDRGDEVRDEFEEAGKLMSQVESAHPPQDLSFEDETDVVEGEE